MVSLVVGKDARLCTEFKRLTIMEFQAINIKFYFLITQHIQTMYLEPKNPGFLINWITSQNVSVTTAPSKIKLDKIAIGMITFKN